MSDDDFREITSLITELSQDITEDDPGVANDNLDRDTLEVSDQSEAFDEALKTLVDDEREILITH